MVELIAFWVPIGLVSFIALLVLILVAMQGKQRRKRHRVKGRSTGLNPGIKPEQVGDFLLLCTIATGVVLGIWFIASPSTSSSSGYFFLLLPSVLYGIRQQQQQQQPVQKAQELEDLQRQLVGMLNGDWDAAYRLVDYEYSRNPGKPHAWYWQAAIETLIRDRR